MRTYYDPEDDTGENIYSSALRNEFADHLRDEAKDRLLDQDGPSPEEIAADAMCDALDATGIHYAQVARALLTRCYNVMSGPAINACQIATGDFDTDEPFNATIIDSLAIKYSKEISEHINQYDA